MPDLQKQVITKLRDVRWFGREFSYSAAIRGIYPQSKVSDPVVSVIIGPGYPSPEVRTAIQSMIGGAGVPVEIIGCYSTDIPWDPGFPHISICLKDRENNLARVRNVAALFARSPMLIFLYSAVLPQQFLISACLDALRKHVALRGRLTGRPGHGAILLQPDLGSTDGPWAMDLEEICAIKRETFLNAIGFDEGVLNGAACLDLSCRLLRDGIPAAQQVYCSGAEGDAELGYEPVAPTAVLDSLNGYYGGQMAGCAQFWQSIRQNGEGKW